MNSGKRLGEYIGKRVELARKDRQWRQSDLVDRLAELGFTQWRQSKIAKIENGETKRLSVEDVVALALALGVQLAYLLSPEDENERIEVAPKVTCTPTDFRRWLRGEWPLIAADEKTYWLGALVPESAWKSVLGPLQEAGTLVLTPGLLAEAQAKEADDA